MVQATESEARQNAVTPERFAKAKTYQEYIASIKNNQQKFADNYEKTQVPEELAKRLRALSAKPNGPAKVLVIGEDWCPDVYRGMPVICRIAEVAGWEMRVVERDQNLDIAEHFKKDGQFLSIPTAIFYTRDFKYITHWIERPERVTAEIPEITGPIYAPYSARALQEKYGREPTEEEKAEAAKQRAAAADQFQATSPHWARWRQVTIEDITEKLEQAVG
jgi:thiol-disulfide isomerase/thioredoxin